MSTSMTEDGSDLEADSEVELDSEHDAETDAYTSSSESEPESYGPLYWLETRTFQNWFTFIVVAGCVLFVFSQLSPADVFSTTTPAGGDMGAHVWGPAYLRDHLLPSLTGWTPDWFAGFPLYRFYMVLPSLAIALLSYVLPYGLAFKLIAVSGLLTLPVACWAFGKLTRLPFPVPPLLAVASMFFLFDQSFSILGGNIPSTMAGEFSFSISLSLVIVFLGVVGRGIETGRDRTLATILFAIAALCHVIPTFFAIAGVFVWWLLSLTQRTGIKKRTVWIGSVGLVGGALVMWWYLPFLARSTYMTDMGWGKRTYFVDMLFQRTRLDGTTLQDWPPIEIVLAIAVIGALFSLVKRRRAGVFLIVVAIMTAVAVVILPENRLWNARLLPFWYLSLYLLAAIGVGEIIRLLAAQLGKYSITSRRRILFGSSIAAAAIGFIVLALPLRALPNEIGIGSFKVQIGETTPTGGLRWMGLEVKRPSFIPAWAKWNFTGYEGKAAYAEYRNVMSTMNTVGQENGCGRALWEHESQHDRYGTPMALMLLPFWTDGCIGSMEGLYFESSGTTGYHFLLQDETSFGASNPQRDLAYISGPPDKAQFDKGVSHMQMLGVRYYMAITEWTKAFANENPNLEIVAATGPWVIYEVKDAPLVQALENQPAVLQVEGHTWLENTESWYLDQSQWKVWPAAGGPVTWQRVLPGEQPEVVSVKPAIVSNVVEGRDSVEFDVDVIGTPVLVKVSYFPNWRATGAQGPWRVGPNLMVVVPNAKHVELHYEQTPVEYLSYGISLLGLIGLWVLWRRGDLEIPAARPFRPFNWQDGRDLSVEHEEPEKNSEESNRDLIDSNATTLLSVLDLGDKDSDKDQDT